MDTKVLSIRLNGAHAGILEQTQTGKMQFTYDANATQVISLAMPIQSEAYDNMACEAFFGGLLPESENAKKEIGKRYGVSAHNTFALLRAIGYDCAGAISCHMMDDSLSSQKDFPLVGKIVSEEELYLHIKSLPQKPLFMDFEGLRLSLAGVHDKAAVCKIEGQIALPHENCPTTFILKAPSAHYEGLEENEYFCMKIAKRLGLPAPSVEIKKIKDITFLLVERYDRVLDQERVSRIHQEDFCQALGVLSSRKYQSEGGPGFKECFELLNKTTYPAIDRSILLRGLIFNYLIGNMDAHAKNFSLLHKSENQIILAPFYDLLCTRAYPALTHKMAMKIGSKYEADAVLERHIIQLCETLNFKYGVFIEVLKEQTHMLLDAAEQERKELKSIGYYHAVIDEIIRFFERQVLHINTKILS